MALSSEGSQRRWVWQQNYSALSSFCVKHGRLRVFRSDQRFPVITRKKKIKEEFEDKACSRLSPWEKLHMRQIKGQIKSGISRRGEEQPWGYPAETGGLVGAQSRGGSSSERTAMG